MRFLKKCLVSLAFGLTFVGCNGLEPFGFGSLHSVRQPVQGVRPLLTILVQDPTLTQRLFHDAAFYQAKLYDEPFNLKNYFTSVSNGKFTFSNAGILGPFDEDPESKATGGELHLMKFALMEAGRRGFNYAVYDTNHDGVVDSDELSILQIDNGSDVMGATRTPECVTPPNSTVRVCLTVAAAGARSSFATWTHELSHGLGAFDLYGTSCLAQDIALMSCTAFPDPDLMFTFYHDPWHRLRWGWVTPRLVDVATEGCYVLSSVENNTTEASPLLLYSSKVGPLEYFLLEDRERQTGVNPYDRTGQTKGVALWSVRMDGSFQPFRIPGIGDPNGTDPSVYPMGAPNFVRNNGTLWNETHGEFKLAWQNGNDVGVKIRLGALVGGLRKLQVTLASNNYAEGKGPCGVMAKSGSKPNGLTEPEAPRTSRGFPADLN